MGKWNWNTPQGISSHIDHVLIPFCFGIPISYLIFKRMLNPSLVAMRNDNIFLRVYSMPILVAFICLFHAGMTLNINVMMLVSVLIVKSNSIIKV